MKQHAALELHPAKKRRKEAKAFKTHRKEKKKKTKRNRKKPQIMTTAMIITAWNQKTTTTHCLIASPNLRL
jgi:hypothetical protein